MNSDQNLSHLSPLTFTSSIASQTQASMSIETKLEDCIFWKTAERLREKYNYKLILIMSNDKVFDILVEVITKVSPKSIED